MSGISSWLLGSVYTMIYDGFFFESPRMFFHNTRVVDIRSFLAPGPSCVPRSIQRTRMCRRTSYPSSSVYIPCLPMYLKSTNFGSHRLAGHLPNPLFNHKTTLPMLKLKTTGVPSLTNPIHRHLNLHHLEKVKVKGCTGSRRTKVFIRLHRTAYSSPCAGWRSCPTWLPRRRSQRGP